MIWLAVDLRKRFDCCLILKNIALGESLKRRLVAAGQPGIKISRKIFLFQIDRQSL